jgi:crossover junction endodeoxyribonuclease RuvC
MTTGTHTPAAASAAGDERPAAEVTRGPAADRVSSGTAAGRLANETSAETDLATRAGGSNESPAAGGLENRNSTAAGPLVIGVDLSLSATGIAGPTFVTTIRSSGHKTDTLNERSERLSRIRYAVIRACKAAQLVVLEGPAYNARDPFAHDRSGLWWMVVRGLHANAIPVAIVAPSQVKKYATGKGSNGRKGDNVKDAVLIAVVKRYPQFDVTNNNEADALVLRAIGMDHLGVPLAAVPQTHRTVLGAIDWPAVTGR